MMHVDCKYSWKLNERHYGDSQGKNKDDVLKEVGEDFFLSVRRGYDTPPPSLPAFDKRSPEYDSNYKALDSSILPLAESLKDTSKRVINYFFEAIAPELAQGKTVLIAAHGNSLRALIEFLEHISTEDIAKLEVATGIPHLYEFDAKLNVIDHYKLK